MSLGTVHFANIQEGERAVRYEMAVRLPREYLSWSLTTHGASATLRSEFYDVLGVADRDCGRGVQLCAAHLTQQPPQRGALLFSVEQEAVVTPG